MLIELRTVEVLPSRLTFWPCVYWRLKLKLTVVCRSFEIECPEMKFSRCVLRRSTPSSRFAPFLSPPCTLSSGCHWLAVEIEVGSLPSWYTVCRLRLYEVRRLGLTRNLFSLIRSVIRPYSN